MVRYLEDLENKIDMDDLRNILLTVYDKGYIDEFKQYCNEWFIEEELLNNMDKQI